MTNPSDRVYVAVLASGSEANCICIFYQNRALIVDAGLSPKILGERCRAIGMPLAMMPDGSPRKVDALLLTHWHSDHAAYATKLCVDWACPLITSRSTFQALEPQPPRWKNSKPGEGCDLPEDSLFEVMPIAVDHDAEGARAFVIQAGVKTIVVAHDLGHPNAALLAACTAADAVLIEANHDPEMLAACTGEAYTPELKERIANDRGHLSNQQAAEVIAACTTGRLQWACALHVSRRANDPTLVERALRVSLKPGAMLHVASQHQPLLLEINGSPETRVVNFQDDHAVAVRINREVDSIIAQQVSANAETQRRKTRLGKLFADMAVLFEDNEPAALGLLDSNGEVCPNFTAWKVSKAHSLGISPRTADYYYEIGKFLLPAVGEDAAENMTIGAGEVMALYAKSKPNSPVPPELVEFAQTHPAHEVKRQVFRLLYHGNGHFSGPASLLQIEAKQADVAQIMALLAQIKELPSPPATSDAEIIEYALKEFLDSEVARQAEVLSLAPTEAPSIGDLLEAQS